MEENKNLTNQNAEEEQKETATTNKSAEETPKTEESKEETTTTDEAAEKEAPTPEQEKEPVTSPHDDFDWSIDKRHVSTYSKEDKEKYEKMYDGTFKDIEEEQVLKGNVVSITNADAVINIGFKSDGLISLNEFRDLPDLKKGDEVEVYVVEKEDRNGQLHLSHRQARVIRSWENIVDAYKTGELIVGTIINKTKGGLIVDINGLETFLPGSQIDVKPVTDYDQYVGKTMEFKVVKINEAIRNAVVSHKALIESDIEEQRAEIISKLEKGQVLEGTIKNITDFGAFIDLGGVDGLLYITDISWGRINHPLEVLQLDQKVNVVVLDFDDAKKRISLGLKQLTPHPWDTLPDEIQEDATVKGKIVNIEDYGAFLEILPGVEGLIHVSEISWSSTPINAKEFFDMGTEYEAKVVTLNKEDRKMSLSIKQLSEDPWDKIEEAYPVDSKHDSVVKNITPYGVFVEMETGIGGMVHISDLSWTKRYGHPNEFTKVGNDLEVVVLSIDKENRKLSLGHKQVEEDPWDTFEGVFPIGSLHQGTIVRKDDKGASVQLEYGLEAFAPARHLKTEDERELKVDDTIDIMIIEFDRDDKRIIVSHTRTWQQKIADEKIAASKEKRANVKKTKKAVKNVQSKVEKSTFGDLDALAEIKEKLKNPKAKNKNSSEDKS
ncbi:MAG TPA: 30S ribosomal protein S1 [Chitinophagaceae bacterium]|nr:30S ribosomal protein S1 [Chitinophagaceae bacterium]